MDANGDAEGIDFIQILFSLIWYLIYI
jgi:hypothetical protein